MGQSNSNFYYFLESFPSRLVRKEAGHTILSRGEKYLITAIAVSAESSKL